MAEMTEEAYLIATNVAKLRAAEALLQDCLFLSETAEAQRADAIKAVQGLALFCVIEITD